MILVVDLLEFHVQLFERLVEFLLGESTFTLDSISKLVPSLGNDADHPEDKMTHNVERDPVEQCGLLFLMWIHGQV